jgi:RimJ/RimL family protein N-acetyltransferase
MKVEIKPFSKDYIAEIQEYASLVENTRYTHVPFPYPEDGAAFYQNHCEQSWRKGESHEFVVLVDGVVAGMCGVLGLKETEATVGYWLHHTFWRKGVGTKMLKLLLEHCRSLDLAEVIAPILEENMPSRALAEKCGFHYSHKEQIALCNEKFPGREILKYRYSF